MEEVESVMVAKQAKDKQQNLTCFGIKVYESGKVKKVSQTDATYFRNMCIEFFARHFPDDLWRFFPEMQGPWKWGKCVSEEAFKKFTEENFVIWQDAEGRVHIGLKSRVDEVVYDPNVERRRYIKAE